MKVIAWDPGPVHSAWAVLDIGAGLRPTFRHVESGVVTSLPEMIAFVLGRHPDVDVVAIERAEQAFPRGADLAALRGRARQLMLTTRVEERIELLATRAGYRVETVPATIWRATICAARAPDDARVKRAVMNWVTGMPKRTNAHERDAMGLAVFVGLRAPRKVA